MPSDHLPHKVFHYKLLSPPPHTPPHLPLLNEDLWVSFYIKYHLVLWVKISDLCYSFRWALRMPSRRISWNMRPYLASPSSLTSKDGLRKTNAHCLLQSFPESCIELFTFSGTVSPDEVLDALYVGDTETLMQPSDNITLECLHRYVQSCSEGVIMLHGLEWLYLLSGYR